MGRQGTVLGASRSERRPSDPAQSHRWGPYINRFSPGEKWEFEKDYIRGPQGLISTRDSQGTNLFFHQDHLGTARLVTSNSGQVKGRHNYYPFGTQASISGTDESESKFTGHSLDRGGDTYYMLGRTYAFPWMRFTSPDPVRDGWNLYAYTGNNPIRFIDPTGLAAKPISIVISFDEDLGLSEEEQTTISLAIRKRLINAGVKNVQVFLGKEGFFTGESWIPGSSGSGHPARFHYWWCREFHRDCHGSHGE